MFQLQRAILSRHCSSGVVCSSTQQRRMASAISYSRKRRKGAETLLEFSGNSSSSRLASVKHEFDEFRHASSAEKTLEFTPTQMRKAKKTEELEEEEPLAVHENRVVVKDDALCGSGDGGGAESKASIRVHVAAGEEGCEALLKVVDEMVVALAPLTFKAPVAFVYNPLEYARNPHEEYVRTYGGKKVDVLLVGMNPGPFGMAQTGVPFGDSVLVREFLHISSEVEPPKEMHPKRPIIGLKCPRREVSGQRLWGWAQARFGTANAFFDRFWIHNYCPLMFMEPSGKNRTPDKLTITERASIISICNVALRAVIEVTNPRIIVGIGKYTVERVKQCAPPGVLVGDIMHPSPANPKANKGWDKIIEAQLRALGRTSAKLAKHVRRLLELVKLVKYVLTLLITSIQVRRKNMWQSKMRNCIPEIGQLARRALL